MDAGTDGDIQNLSDSRGVVYHARNYLHRLGQPLDGRFTRKALDPGHFRRRGRPLGTRGSKEQGENVFTSILAAANRAQWNVLMHLLAERSNQRSRQMTQEADSAPPGIEKRSTLAVVQALIEAFPKCVEVHDKDGWLPLHVAVYRRASLEVVKDSWSISKELEKETKSGRLLHLAVEDSGSYPKLYWKLQRHIEKRARRGKGGRSHCTMPREKALAFKFESPVEMDAPPLSRLCNKRMSLE